MKKQHLYLILGVTMMLLFIADPALAQPGGGGPPIGGGGGPGCWPPPCVPIDGGMSFLAMLGVAFGGKKLLDLRK
jgi:hypothetical protein